MQVPVPLAKQATAQRRLLAELRWGSASATDLAQRSGIGRTSASRALRALEGRSLVAKGAKRRWSLTPEGLKVSGRLPASLGPFDALAATLAAHQRTRQTVGSVFAAGVRASLFPWLKDADRSYRLVDGPASIARIADAAVEVQPGVDSLLAASRTMGDFVNDRSGVGGIRTPLDFTRNLTAYLEAGLSPPAMGTIDMLRDSLRPALGGAIAAIFATQRVQMDALSAGLATRAWWTSAVAESMVPTTRIASDLADLSSILGSRRAVVRDYGGRFGVASESVVGAHARNVADFLTWLAPAPPEARHLAADLILPGKTTAAFVGGIRGLLAPHDEDETLGWEPIADAGVQDLASRLESVDHGLAEMYLGAWDAVRRGGPDWGRHLSQSAREVLRHLIARLAPAEDVRGKYGAVTRRTRVRFVVATSSDTATEFVETMAEHVFITLDILSAEAKDSGGGRFNRQGRIGVLESVGGLIRILLATSTEAADRGPHPKPEVNPPGAIQLARGPVIQHP